MCVSVYVSLLHDSASCGARTALAPCLETWLAPWLAPCYGSRRPTLYLLAMIWPLLLVGSLQHVWAMLVWRVQGAHHEYLPKVNVQVT